MYAVDTNEKFHGKTFPYVLIDDGPGTQPVDAAEQHVTVTLANGANEKTGDSVTVTVPGDPDFQQATFKFIKWASDTTGGQGFIAEDTATGQLYFFTNSLFTGKDNPAAEHLNVFDHSLPHALPHEVTACFLAGTRVAGLSGDEGRRLAGGRSGDDVRWPDRAGPLDWSADRVAAVRRPVARAPHSRESRCARRQRALS
jgi:hypothetical protein